MTTKTAPPPSAKRNGQKAPHSAESIMPLMHQRGRSTQAYGTVVRMAIGLETSVCQQITERLNQLLADTMTLRDLYKKHHWQVAGHTFYPLHLLFDKHYEEQSELVDNIAERIQLLGGVSIAMAHDVAELTKVERPPKDREEVPVQISRLLEAHELILRYARALAEKADDLGDVGTNDMLSSKVVPTNEFQAWFVSEHVVDTPLVHADSAES